VRRVASPVESSAGALVDLAVDLARLTPTSPRLPSV
jgi:hypothetical protein